MSNNIGLKKLEKKAYLSYHQDGILDLIIAFCTLGFGISILTDSPAFGILGWMPILFYLPLKKAVTFPRFGYVKFHDSSSSLRVTIFMVVGLVALVFALGVYVFAAGDSFPVGITAILQKYHMLLLGLIMAVGLIIAGAATGMKRMYIYAALYVIIIFVGIELGLRAPYYILVAGGTIFASGLILLVNFLRKYPATKERLDEING